jgi:hypothetical protein
LRILGNVTPAAAAGVTAYIPRASEPAQDVLRVDPDLLEDVPVLLVVDLIRELLLGLLRLVVVATLAEHLDDLLLVDLHRSPSSVAI